MQYTCILEFEVRTFQPAETFMYVGYTVLWYQLEGGCKSCRRFNRGASVFFRVKVIWTFFTEIINQESDFA